MRKWGLALRNSVTPLQDCSDVSAVSWIQHHRRAAQQQHLGKYLGCQLKKPEEEKPYYLIGPCQHWTPKRLSRGVFPWRQRLLLPICPRPGPPIATALHSLPSPTTHQLDPDLHWHIHGLYEKHVFMWSYHKLVFQSFEWGTQYETPYYANLLFLSVSLICRQTHHTYNLNWN